MPNGRTPIQKSQPRDVFLYLLATITLYFSVWSSIDLLFGYINIAFPDPLNSYYDPGAAIRWSLALFIIIFPVYFFVTRFLGRDIAENPGKNEIRIRKWLVYLTLFLAALLMIGDLVALLYNFLNGEVTTRFLLKVFSVLAVAGGVFWYYLYDLRKKPGTFTAQAKGFVWGIIAAYIAIAAAGVVLAGSPFEQRLVRFDDQRVSDLQTIQYQVLNYWQQKGKLPQNLGNLSDSISGFSAPVDPETQAEYEYVAVASTTFQLCAAFDVATPAGRNGGNVSAPAMYPYPGSSFDNWSHSAGHECFNRVIDPQLYPTKQAEPAPVPAKGK